MSKPLPASVVLPQKCECEGPEQGQNLNRKGLLGPTNTMFESSPKENSEISQQGLSPAIRKACLQCRKTYQREPISRRFLLNGNKV